MICSVPICMGTGEDHLLDNGLDGDAIIILIHLGNVPFTNYRRLPR